MGRITQKLHAAPLLERIESRGGLSALTKHRGMDATTYSRVRKAVLRARLSGELSVHLADELCITLLGEHPFHIFGEAWYADTQPTASHSDAPEVPA